MGIVSLQWIRTHMHRLSDGPDSLGLSYMHSLGLRQSYIPFIHTCLPVIFIVGFTFFLMGLTLFLFKISWPVAIPVTLVIACMFAFLVITTLHPAMQPHPLERPSDNPECFPCPYRSPQSSLCLLRESWESRSEIWLRKRTMDFFANKKLLSHLASNPEITAPKPFASDTIKALVSIKESRSAETEKERTALATCLAEVLPIHLDVFPIGDLIDLNPFLPPSRYVPSAVFLHDGPATKEDLSAVALLQVATCNGHPLGSPDLLNACVRTTRWLFERPRTFGLVSTEVPNKQPLQLISKAGTSRLLS